MKKYFLFCLLILCLIFVSIPSQVLAQFPTGHPDDAFSSTFIRGYGSAIDQFNIYVWREDYSMWMEIEPINQDVPFICGTSFFIIQNEVQFDTVELVSVSGDSQCGDVHIPSVFELSQWQYIVDNPADLNYDFTLLFDGGENTYTLDIVYNTKPPIVNTGNDRTVNQGVVVTLDASNCSDPDNDPISIIWTQTGGSAVDLSDETAEKPTFIAPSYNPFSNVLTFLLTVEDGTFRATDEVSITVAEAPLPSVTVSDGGGGGGCFIATAAYGSLMEPHVKILRDFRDRFLLGNTAGDSFIRLYYKYSPPIADFIKERDSLRTMVRISLLPVVGVSWIALKIGPLSTVALMLIFISCFVGLVSFRGRYKE